MCRYRHRHLLLLQNVSTRLLRTEMPDPREIYSTIPGLSYYVILDQAVGADIIKGYIVPIRRVTHSRHLCGICYDVICKRPV